MSFHHDDVIKWKHFPRNWPFARGIHRSPVNSPHKGQWRGALMFSLICTSINDWVNNREAGDLRRNDVHYDVIVMIHAVSNGCEMPTSGNPMRLNHGVHVHTDRTTAWRKTAVTPVCQQWSYYSLVLIHRDVLDMKSFCGKICLVLVLIPSNGTGKCYGCFRASADFPVRYL